MTGVVEVIAVAKAVKEFFGTISTVERQRREKLATLFEKISDLLETYKNNRASGQSPRGLCDRLKEYANAIETVASGALKQDDVDRLVQKLREVCETMQNPPVGSSYEQELDKLAEGAGTFLGCAEVLRLR